MDKNKDLLDHFLNNCPVEAKNYFENIISRLERIEKKVDSFK
jgi:tetrahydromethanopterin S-methyltransferase subunit G|tara:strand:+ start:24 stop:149 length:126 start_codon:yes stop_codon:yes gene_type:complete